MNDGEDGRETHATKTMNQDKDKNPVWWVIEHDFAFDHVKRSIRQKWQGTRRTVVTTEGSNWKPRCAAAIASQNPLSFAEAETAIRFGYGAQVEYGSSFRQWNDDLDFKLAREWLSTNPTQLPTWEQAREAVRYGWTFEDENVATDFGAWGCEGMSMDLAGCGSSSRTTNSSVCGFNSMY
jgi:hypothetical protein